MHAIGREAYASAIKSFDLFGDIAVIDSIPKNARAMAKLLISGNSNIKTVLRKGGAVSGRYRTRKYIYVAGKRNFSAVYKENGCVFKFDLRKTFFSPRLSFERHRIASAAKEGENVIVMFAGAGPFAIELAKVHRKSLVVGIELNKQAYLYMVDNASINKTSNVVAVHGDVRKMAHMYEGFADRIVMPLPKTAHTFLDSVYICAKQRCIVHYYSFGSRESVFDDEWARISRFFSSAGAKAAIIGKRVVRPYSSNEVEAVLDIELEKGRKPESAII